MLQDTMDKVVKVGLGIILALLGFGFWAAIAFIILHFVTKYW